MAILIDQPIWHWRGERWCHLVSDSDLEELHAFAAALGVPRRGFQGDHYDIPERLRDRAVALGAEVVDARVLVRRLRAAGLRRTRSPGSAPSGHHRSHDPRAPDAPGAGGQPQGTSEST